MTATVANAKSVFFLLPLAAVSMFYFSVCQRRALKQRPDWPQSPAGAARAHASALAGMQRLCFSTLVLMRMQGRAAVFTSFLVFFGSFFFFFSFQFRGFQIWCPAETSAANTKQKTLWICLPIQSIPLHPSLGEMLIQYMIILRGSRYLSFHTVIETFHYPVRATVVRVSVRVLLPDGFSGCGGNAGRGGK